MYIAHNLMAANTARNLNAHYANLAISTQRLSTGLRVNRAADDAAGLSIRELQRAEISALQQGVRNANDAISLLQVADGALAIIDEKLIRMKELAEQASTGTYNSTQRLIIDSEFQAMASEIDRIANATDFNGIKLLDGSRQGQHDGSSLNSTGALKIHFGTGNDSVEDYYYLNIEDCTTKGLGLHDSIINNASVRLNDLPVKNNLEAIQLPHYVCPPSGLINMQELFTQGVWGMYQDGGNATDNNFMFKIPKGTKNIVINAAGSFNSSGSSIMTYNVENDLQLFTVNGVHLAGTPRTDYVWDNSNFGILFQGDPTTIAANQDKLPFSETDYNDKFLNSGPVYYDPYGKNLNETTYNNMIIGYSGDPASQNIQAPADWSRTWADYEVLTINEATEDLIVWCPGAGTGLINCIASNLI